MDSGDASTTTPKKGKMGGVGVGGTSKGENSGAVCYLLLISPSNVFVRYMPDEGDLHLVMWVNFAKIDLEAFCDCDSVRVLYCRHKQVRLLTWAAYKEICWPSTTSVKRNSGSERGSGAIGCAGINLCLSVSYHRASVFFRAFCLCPQRKFDLSSV